MTVAQQSPDDDDTPRIRQTTIPLPSRDQVTNVQLHTLLNAAQILNSMVVSRGVVDEDGEPLAKDGGVSAALDGSIIKICTQIDGIIDDLSRWSLKEQNTLEARLAEVYAANLEVLKVQKAATIQTMSPHLKMTPQLFKLEEGTWVAIVGDINAVGKSIVGIGDCPASALADFDKVFNGAPSKLKNENEQHTQKLDLTGNDNGPRPPLPGEDVERNSDGTGPDGGVGPPKIPPF